MPQVEGRLYQREKQTFRKHEKVNVLVDTRKDHVEQQYRGV